MTRSRYEPLPCTICGGPTDTCADDYADETMGSVIYTPAEILCEDCEDGDYDVEEAA